jgi:hypothetical protein
MTWHVLLSFDCYAFDRADEAFDLAMKLWDHGQSVVVTQTGMDGEEHRVDNGSPEMEV